MVYIYVLKLYSNKYYIGKTEDPNFRLTDHFKSGGSVWTKKYKPISIHELRPDCDSNDETTITHEYMKKYGIDNVRGGPWCKIDISEHENAIKQIINSEKDICYKCGKPSHYANKCPQKYKKESNIKSNKIKCERCGRTGHTFQECFAKRDINNNYIVDTESEEEYLSSDEEDCRNEICFKCGRTGHWATNCYAKKDVYGYRI